MSKQFLRMFFLLVLPVVSDSTVHLYAVDPTPEQIEFFETKVRPVLAENCFRCHSDKAEKLKGGFRLASPQADRRTLIRRITYDLSGLPPTFEEVEAFIKDKRPDAYARVVDRLLASPHYGERWGRFWLDVARYADTKGYLAGGEERRYPFSYTYRDYVIRAFNEDKPYDQFVIEQIAADLLPGDRRNLAALGFLTLGRRFL